MTDLIKSLLEKRGVDTSDDLAVEKFLKPNWERDTHDPFHMKDMSKAVERIKKAIDNNESIIIYSDYDCDGIPGAVVLHDFFKKLGHENFSNYIPHRHNEGYGIHKHAIDKFIKDNVKLMITVDLGITNVSEIKYAQDNGIDVILTDHHLPLRESENAEDQNILDPEHKNTPDTKNKNAPDTECKNTPNPSFIKRGTGYKARQMLPPAFAVINTKRDDCEYPEKMLCGCATAWKLANAFLVKYRNEYNIPEGYEKWWLDMVGISTVADMVPLMGENRLLATYGLQVLRKSKRQGIKKILLNAKIKQQYLNETDIGFGIAPRLNAAGRMSDPKEAFLSLLDNAEAETYAMRLEKYNNDRKKETSEANESVDLDQFGKDQVILVGSTEWSPGILGLIASKIVDKTKKTTFVWGQGEDKDMMKGSVRAGEDGANVVQLMSACSALLVHFGGHEQAGGFAIIKDNIKDFEKMLKIEYLKIKDTFIKSGKDISPDISLKPEDITETLFRDLQKLSPFGVGNIAPIIKLKGKMKSVRLFGDKKQHIELNIDGVSCIKFSVNEREKESLQCQEDWLGVIERDVFKGGLKIRML